MIPVLQVPLNEDLAPFTALLWEHQIPHRVIEEAGHQLLLVSPRVDPAAIRQLYGYWKQGGDLGRVELKVAQPRRLAGAIQLRRVPVTLALVLISVLLTLLIGFGANTGWLQWFILVDPFTSGAADLGGTLTSGQWWRLITPIFLHFSVLHIVFNLVMVWAVGARIEMLQGAWALAGLVLLSGLASNLAQYVVSGPMFGGMSGVVFGLLGYTWLWDRMAPRYRFGLPSALMGFMLFWLVLGYTGALESLGLGAIANTAHLAGLLAGLAYWPLGRLFGPR